MISLSYNKNELKSRIYDASEEYRSVCLIEAIADIFSEMSEGLIENIVENSEQTTMAYYKVEVEGETVDCNFAYASGDELILKGSGQIETPDGTYHVDVWISIKADNEGGGVRLRKVSLDLFDDVANLPGIRTNHSVKGNIIEGLSCFVDCSDTELQDIVDSLWKEILKHKDCV